MTPQAGAEHATTVTPLLPLPRSDARTVRLAPAILEAVRARPPLVDAWEATALLESLGYTDARVAQELGFRDALEAGEYVYRQSRTTRGAANPWTPPEQDSAIRIIVRSGASTLIYAVPWLAVFVAQAAKPAAMQMPSPIAPALALALMFSLVASGGFVQAMVRRGEFYVGLRQLRMSQQVVHALLRIGIATIVVAALAAMVVGWYFELFPWSSLVLGADAFVIMSILWMVCGTFAIRQQQWRVAVAFFVGFLVFAGLRTWSVTVVPSLLAAVTAVLAVAALQVRRVFGRLDGHPALPAGVVMPRLSVLVYWTLPYFWYGTVYFAFLFADRLSAGAASAASTGGEFGIPADYNAGMELALLTLLVAASGIEIAGALFGRAFRNEAVRPIGEAGGRLGDALRMHYIRALILTLGVFVLVALAIALMARRALPGPFTADQATTLLLGDVGYAALAVGLMNALVLFEVRSAWEVVRLFTAAFAVNLLSGYLLAHLFGRYHAADGLVIGATFLAFTTTVAVRRMFRSPDYAYAVS